MRARLRLRLRRGGRRRRLLSARVRAAGSDAAPAGGRAEDDRGIADELDPQDDARLLRTAIDPATPLLPRMLRDADALLVKARSLIMDAAGLVLCDDRAHARATAALLRTIAGEKPVVVVSDEVGAPRWSCANSSRRRPARRSTSNADRQRPPRGLPGARRRGRARRDDRCRGALPSRGGRRRAAPAARAGQPERALRSVLEFVRRRRSLLRVVQRARALLSSRCGTLAPRSSQAGTASRMHSEDSAVRADFPWPRHAHPRNTLSPPGEATLFSCS